MLLLSASKIAGADTTQTAIGAIVGTSLGDGVDLTLKLSNNEYDAAHNQQHVVVMEQQMTSKRGELKIAY